MNPPPFDPWQDTIPAWIGSIGGIASVAIAIAALVIGMLNARKYVEWTIERGDKPSRRALVQKTSGIDAEIVDWEEIEGSAITVYAERGKVLGAGEALPITVDRSLADPYPSQLRLKWREGKVHGKRRSKVRERVFYLD